MASYEVAGAENHDWESLALDDEGSLYIGDFGNNTSRRGDLTVYVVDEPQIGATRGGVAVPPLEVRERLEFIYPEQSQPPDGRVLDFDGESLFWARGELYLLTKERTAHGTTLYRFGQNPKEPAGRSGESAEKVEPMSPTRVALHNLGHFGFADFAHPSRGTATSADATPDGRYLAVLGYNVVFIFQRPDEGDNYLASKPWPIALNLMATKQCEGITWDGDDLLLSNEQGELHRIVAPLRLRPSSYP